MNSFFSKFIKKSSIQYNTDGITVFEEGIGSLNLSWDKVNKIIFVNFFEEYSGYFLTEDYKSKKDYNSIYLDNIDSNVKVRTGGTPTVKKNVKNPFEVPHGTTNISKVFFVEYKNADGNNNLYAVHYTDKYKKTYIKDFTSYIGKDSVLEHSRLDGFYHLSSLK